ncbi:MAG TPA: HepT-like ribonuclease domain-containing protein [Candidatus Binataceae bacterium]|nr:HepT-like ribonuclease domain-containing protein [Candidatus Binataceae bacterium]
MWDARDAADVIATMTANKTFADFDGDIILRSAVERQFEILGEALGQLVTSPSTRAPTSTSRAIWRRA